MHLPPSLEYFDIIDSIMMKHITVLFGFVASAMAAVVPPAPALPLPLGEVGWQGSVTPGGPTIEVWGESFEVRDAQDFD